LVASARHRRDPWDAAETTKRRRGETAIEEAVTNAEAVTAVTTADGEGATVAIGASGVAEAVAEAEEEAVAEADTNRVAASMAGENTDVAMRDAVVLLHVVGIATVAARAAEAADMRNSVEDATSRDNTIAKSAMSAKSVTSATTERASASVKNTNATTSSSFKRKGKRRPDLTRRLRGTTSN
jgi:hypothetical protein